MSKQTSIIKLKGTLSGISFYKSEGQYLARVANGPTKEQIDSDINFQRTRENNAEFGGSATVSKTLRLSLIAALQSVADSRVVSRLTKLFKEINTKGLGVRGQRAITLSDNKSMLLGFEFNRFTRFSSVFNGTYEMMNNNERTSSNVFFTGMIPQLSLRPPQGATHFRLVLATGTVSDYLYDSGSKKYEPIEALQNGLSGINYSGILPINNTPQTLTLSTALPFSDPLDEEVSVVECLGIDFFQQVNGEFYLLAQGNALKVINVF